MGSVAWAIERHGNLENRWANEPYVENLDHSAEVAFEITSEVEVEIEVDVSI